MPNPSFEPIIGQSFGDIAQQRSFWAGFNRNVEENNIARLNAAQQNQNNYLLRLASIQQDQADRQAAAQERDVAMQQAMQLRLRDESLARDAEERRRFEFDTGRASEGERFDRSFELQQRQIEDSAAQRAARQAEADRSNWFSIAMNAVQSGVADTPEKLKAYTEKLSGDEARVVNDTAAAMKKTSTEEYEQTESMLQALNAELRANRRDKAKKEAAELLGVTILNPSKRAHKEKLTEINTMGPEQLPPLNDTDLEAFYSAKGKQYGRLFSYAQFDPESQQFLPRGKARPIIPPVTEPTAGTGTANAPAWAGFNTGSSVVGAAASPIKVGRFIVTPQ